MPRKHECRMEDSGPSVWVVTSQDLCLHLGSELSLLSCLESYSESVLFLDFLS